MNVRFSLALQAILILAFTMYLAKVYGTLPDIVPSHYGFSGKPDATAPKSIFLAAFFSTIAIMPVTTIAVAMSRRKLDQKVLSRLNILMVLMTAYLGLIGLVVIKDAQEPGFPVLKVIIGLLFILMYFVGLMIIDVPRNPVMGVRVKWTLETDKVWVPVHRFAGKLWATVSMICALGVLIGVPYMTLLVVFFVAMLLPVVYAGQIYKRLKK